MKNCLKICFVFLSICLSSILNAGNLQANFSYAKFFSPEQGAYVETYLTIDGGSMQYPKDENGKYSGAVEVVLIFKQEEKVVDFKKYNLQSPAYDDSVGVRRNLIDQQRFLLPNGDYDFEISLRDINANVPAFKNTQKVALNFNESAMDISDIELVESFTKTENKSLISKSGYDLMPYTSDFFGEDFEKIAFYIEVYNADKTLGVDEAFLINYFIESYETGEVVNNYRSFKREKGKAVNVLFGMFDIKNLASGNYKLVVEARSKENDLLVSKKAFFQRSNPNYSQLLVADDYGSSFVNEMADAEMEDAVKCLAPISDATELSFAENQLGASDYELMRQYFYNFWLTRSQEDPKAEWKKYKELVDVAQDKYSTMIKRGYETDRGRVFLKYGKPNTISELKNEPSSYPYEIWHYYGVETRSNVKFVFYNPDIISNDYPLLHSTMPGEINNLRWKIDLHRRTNQPNDISETEQNEYMQDRTNEFFELPK